MDWLKEIIIGVRLALDKPDVAWSGLGTYVVSVFLGLAGAGALWFLARLFKKKNASDQRNTNDWFFRNRDKLLERLKRDLNDRRKSFLLGQNSLDLEKELSPDAVDRPYSRQDSIEYTLERDGTEVESTDQPITDLFQQPEVGQRLAILGKPGSGKTVCLLRLVEYLLKQANGDTEKPLPIIFECSEWDGRELLPWMAWQLNRKYDIKEEIGLQMIEERDILPLFDGLDELAAEKQGDFVRLFNALPNDRPQVVCCRVKEYGQLQDNSGVRLALKNAVILQDISIPRLKGHLLRQGLDELWNMLEQSENEADPSLSPPAEDGQQGEQPQSLLELAQRPLFLGIMIGVAEKLRKGVKRQEGESWEELLWRLYLNDCLALRTPPPNEQPDDHDRKYAQARSRHWLHCLARWMQKEDKVALQLDELQPSMLQGYWRFGLSYWLVVGLFWGLIGGLFAGTGVGAATGLVFSLYYYVRARIIAGQSERIRIENIRLFRLSISLLKTVIAGQSVGMVISLLFLAFSLGSIQVEDKVAMLLFWLVFTSALFTFLAIGLENIANPVRKTAQPQQHLRDALHSSLVLFPLFVFASMIIFVPVLFFVEQHKKADVSSFLNMRIFIALFLAAIGSFIILGTNQILQHYLLRLCLRTEHQLPLRLVPWLNTMHQRKVFQRVGGSYHFLHKQLRDYLAKQTEMKKQAS